ncbi:MAG TPA: hypothetical protein VHL59_14315 [Thermoanaerobaculia bacterium]|nr:hypothetical protein [Thermoanaerobaculia bacterium]
MIVLSRIIAALAYTGAAFLFGLILGERGELGAVQYAFTIVIPVATVVLTYIARQGRPEVFATGLAMFAGLWLGQRAFADAFERCPAEVAPIRAAIVAHQTRTGDYPSRLQDLGLELPCDCILRKTILHYFGGDRGFRLWITNDREQREFGRRRSTAT